MVISSLCVEIFGILGPIKSGSLASSSSSSMNVAKADDKDGKDEAADEDDAASKGDAKDADDADDSEDAGDAEDGSNAKDDVAGKDEEEGCGSRNCSIVSEETTAVSIYR